jgi:hypothetical protein
VKTPTPISTASIQKEINAAQKNLAAVLAKQVALETDSKKKASTYKTWADGVRKETNDNYTKATQLRAAIAALQSLLPKEKSI